MAVKYTVILSWLLSLCLYFTSSDAYGLCMKVDLIDGTSDQFLLSEKPVITFDGDICRISCESIEAHYELAKVSRTYFSGYSEGSVSLLENEVTIDYLDNTRVQIKGLKSGVPVTLYSLDGTIALSLETPANGIVSFSLEKLTPKSVYILSINSINKFKIYKK